LGPQAGNTSRCMRGQLLEPRREAAARLHRRPPARGGRRRWPAGRRPAALLATAGSAGARLSGTLPPIVISQVRKLTLAPKTAPGRGNAPNERFPAPGRPTSAREGPRPGQEAGERGARVPAEPVRLPPARRHRARRRSAPHRSENCGDGLGRRHALGDGRTWEMRTN